MIHSGSRLRFVPTVDDADEGLRRWSGGGAVHLDVSECGLSVRMWSGWKEAYTPEVEWMLQGLWSVS